MIKKNNEIRELDVIEINNEIIEVRQKIMLDRLKYSCTGARSNIKQLKKYHARLKTIQKELEAN